MKIRLTINHAHVAKVLQARRETATGESFKVAGRGRPMTPHENAVAILRAATVREIGCRRWGPGGGHLASYTQARRSSTGWLTFRWRHSPEEVRAVDLARHRRIAKAAARELIERNAQ